MSRSIDAARRRRGMNRIVERVPEAGAYMREYRVGCLLRERTRPFPASLDILMNVSMRMVAST